MLNQKFQMILLHVCNLAPWSRCMYVCPQLMISNSPLYNIAGVTALAGMYSIACCYSAEDVWRHVGLPGIASRQWRFWGRWGRCLFIFFAGLFQYITDIGISTGYCKFVLFCTQHHECTTLVYWSIAALKWLTCVLTDYTFGCWPHLHDIFTTFRNR